MENIPESASILLVGSNNILALSVIRALGSLVPDAKIHTLSFEQDNRSISEQSKYVDSRHFIDTDNLEEQSEKLISCIKKTEADILLPVEEHNVRLISLLKHDLKKYVHLPPLPSPFIFDALVNKENLGKLLKKYDLPRPQNYSLREADSSLSDLQTLYPCLLKPVKGSSGTGIKVINNYGELRRNISSIDKNEYLLQEYIPGEDIGCSFLAIDGELKTITVQKVLNGKKMGVATAMEFISDHAVDSYVRRLLGITGYSGWANLDFRRDSRDGRLKLIDFNARFWFSLLASKAAGVDFTKLICLQAVGANIIYPESRNITYFMGRNTFKYYLKKMIKPASNSGSVFTDLWDRISDPMPEIARYIKK